MYRNLPIKPKFRYSRLYASYGTSPTPALELSWDDLPCGCRRGRPAETGKQHGGLRKPLGDGGGNWEVAFQPSGRGRDPGYPEFPARIPASGNTAQGSCHGFAQRTAAQAKGGECGPWVARLLRGTSSVPSPGWISGFSVSGCGTRAEPPGSGRHPWPPSSPVWRGTGIPPDDRCQPFPLLHDRFMYPLPEFLLHPPELGREALAHGGSGDPELPVPVHPASSPPCIVGGFRGAFVNPALPRLFPYRNRSVASSAGLPICN